VVLGGLLPRFVEMQVYHAILESIASEQSARMVAMRNATDSAKELTQELTLIYNKARQEVITKELLDIVGGASALAYVEEVIYGKGQGNSGNRYGS
jgi:F-type H+-transporting ATPase subunit gamma